MNNIAYCGMCADIIHVGHINIIKEANKLDCDKVIIGLLTDGAICSYKSPPYMIYEDRKIIVENIIGVDTIIPQHTLDYTDNILLLKPRYVVHGDDWLDGIQKLIRDKVNNLVNLYGGKIIDIPYTKNISSSYIKNIKGIEEWKNTQPP